jgi:hypothetical protein
MTTTALTGKSMTFSYGGMDATAQVTSSNIDKQASSTTIQTYGGSAAVSQGVERTVTCDYLFDGDQAAGGFHAILDAAVESQEPGELTVEAGASSWTGSAIVTGVTVDGPADDAVTVSATYVISGDFPFTAGVTPFRDDEGDA